MTQTGRARYRKAVKGSSFIKVNSINYDAFYHRTGTIYSPSEATVGPWSSDAQHGGPPAALITKSFEEFEPRDNTRIVRIAIEILRPIPLGRTEIKVSVLRPGRKIELLGSQMFVDDKLVMTAQAWRMRSSIDLTEDIGSEPAPLPPTLEPEAMTSDEVFFPYADSIDWCYVEGGFDFLGSSTVWSRPKIPLVAGEPTSPLARLLLMADSANGVSSVLPFNQWTFVPVDLCISIYRYPKGEWLAMRAETLIGPDGVGTTRATLFDNQSSVGSSIHTLFVEPH